MRLKYEVPVGKQRLTIEFDTRDLYDGLCNIADASASLPAACGICGNDNVKLDCYRGGQYGPSISAKCGECNAYARIKKRKQESGGGFYLAEWDKPNGGFGNSSSDTASEGDDETLAF